VGTQYRSVVLYHSESQRHAAEQAIAELTEGKIWDDAIVTQIAPFTVFYPAEQYHQNYFAQNPDQPYCQIVIAPKVSKFRKAYLDRLKK
jgi:peptide-methionine (S)-S-oxide reductase